MVKPQLFPPGHVPTADRFDPLTIFTALRKKSAGFSRAELEAVATIIGQIPTVAYEGTVGQLTLLVIPDAPPTRFAKMPICPSGSTVAGGTGMAPTAWR